MSICRSEKTLSKLKSRIGEMRESDKRAVECEANDEPADLAGDGADVVELAVAHELPRWVDPVRQRHHQLSFSFCV